MSSSDKARRIRRKNSSGPSGRREMDQQPARDRRAAPYQARDSRAAERDRRPRRDDGAQRREDSVPRRENSSPRREDSAQRREDSNPRRDGGQPRRDPRGYGTEARRDGAYSRGVRRDDAPRGDGGIYNSRGGGRSREYRRTYAAASRASEGGSPRDAYSGDFPGDAYSGAGGTIEEQRYAASRRSSQTAPSRRRRQKPGRRLRRRHLLPVFLLPTLVLAAVLFTGNRLLFQEPIQQMEPISAPVQQPEADSVPAEETERVPFSSVSVIPEGLRNLVLENPEDPEEEEFDWDAAFPDDPDTELEDLSQERGHKTRKKNFFTFLVAGKDNNNGGSDTMILASLDKNGKKITGISLPRDTKCYVDNKARKLNYAFNNGGIESLAKTVSWQLGIPIDYTVVVDLNGFAALVDAIGGVDFEVPIDMDYDDPAQDLYIGFEKGMQHLDGKDALKVVRFRHNWDGTGYGDEDLGRMRTQQQFLKTVAKKVLTPANINKVGKFADIFRQYVQTNLSLGNLAWLGKEAIFIGADGVEFSTLPGEWTYPYIYLNQEKVLALLNERMNPYEEPLTARDLHIAK